MRGDTLDVFDLNRAHAVAIEKQHAPIADRRPVAELQSNRLRIVHLQLERRQHFVLRALDFFGPHRLLFHALHRAREAKQLGPRRARGAH